ncbi:uncharacterized membrane protein YraQ (UPF0718 family) [Bacillus tianshenii]|uniref:Uncharacterized membrane protein YraQ (UPF0718 family) n=1 Tax=Sutcliffiella tianshenii TaxID=1463404 RepID=A0ABS2P402_9BACI|nr:hypothetical protein [Bacillus tianshenii]MBM7621604.1 uncharacterized membrane protein YraQ (UPF0718 family) [Bacillus tianshenii]
MIGWLIIACEIGFWIFILLGLISRYIFKWKKTGMMFLASTPVIDLVLVVATIIDLKNGQQATSIHGLAAIYLGVTVAFGKSMIRWADERFAYHFSNGPKPLKKSTHGPSHAKMERNGWFRHLLGWIIGNAFLLGMIVLVGDPARTEELVNIMRLWAIILGADFLYSFSYTVFPKKPPVNSGHQQG